MVEGQLVELLLLVGFLEVLQPDEVDSVVADINIFDLAQLEIRNLDLDNFLHIGLFWSIPLNILPHNFGELLILGLGLKLGQHSIREHNQQEVLDQHSEHQPLLIEGALTGVFGVEGQEL